MRSTVLAVIVVALSVACAAQESTAGERLGSAAGSSVYTLFSGPKRAGSLIVERLPDGEQHFRVTMDAGSEGPDLDARVRFGASGVPKALALTGRDARKKPLTDRFVFENGRAEWNTGIDHGERTVAAKAYYLTAPVVEQQISAIPGEIGWLAKALLASPRLRLPLLPFGDAAIEKIQTIEVSSGKNRRRVTEYAIRGLDLSPVPVWLDDKHDLFAVTGVEWVATIREGWEDCLAALRKAQQDAAEASARALAARLSVHPAGPVVFRHASLFDAEAAELRRDMTVVVSGERITAVGREGELAIPSRARIIDCRGMTLLPGLWDMHTHFGPNDGTLHLSFGVTSARDMGNYVRRVMELREDFDQGVRIGPRLFLAGLIEGRGPYQAPTEVLVDTEEEAREAVEWFSRLGYVQMKIYGSIKPELVPFIARFAHEHNMRVSGHIPAHMTAAQAVQEGFDEVNHTNYLFLNFMPEVTEIQTQVRITAPAERAPDINLHSAAARDFFTILRDHHTAIDPTLNIYETRYTARKGAVDPAFASVEASLPYRWRRNAYAGGIEIPEGKDQRYRASFQAFLDMIGEIHRAGVTTVVGSDGFPGLGYVRELELQVKAGIPAAQVLQSATLGSARLLKQDGGLGTVAAGKLADLVVVAGDPVQDISDIRHTRWVMRGGVLYSASALRQACGLNALANDDASGGGGPGHVKEVQ